MKRFGLILTIFSILMVMVGVVGAQDDDTSRSDVRGGLIRAVIQATSAETGLQPSQILAQLAPDGATLADVIVANGGSVDAVVSTAVTNATERANEAVANNTITQDQADRILENLEQVITDGVNGELSLISDANPRDGIERALAVAVTELTELEASDIIQQVRDGSTLADIITDNGSTVEDVTARAMAIATERVTKWIENDRITQEQGDELLSTLEGTFTDILNGEFRPNRPDLGERGERGLGILRQIAEETGLTPRELLPQLRDGVTPAQILTDEGVDVDTFVSGLLVDTEERLANAVENGRLTQEQADERLETIRTTLTDRLDQPVNRDNMMPPESESGN